MSLYVDIRKHFGNFKLDVSFEADSEVLALLGASGCGKSVTLKCVAGIITPDEGKIILNGRTLFDSEKRINISPQKRLVGYLFQQYALFPNMTVEQNITAGARRNNKNNAKEATLKYIDLFKLNGLEKKHPSELSGGEQQRTALARIMINGPELLLLDEPFSALDSYLKWQLELELYDTLKSFGLTSLFVSHSKDEVYRLCDSVCVLSNGKSEKKTSVKELFSSPETYASALLAGCKNFSEVKCDSNMLTLTDWGISIPLSSGFDKSVKRAGIYSENIQVSQNKSDLSVRCAILRISEDLNHADITVKTPTGGLLHIECSKEYAREFAGSKELYVSFSNEKIMFLR